METNHFVSSEWSGTFVIKCQPTVRTLLTIDKIFNEATLDVEFIRNFSKISFPYHTFVVNYRVDDNPNIYYPQVHLFFHTDNERKESYLPYLPNCDSRGRICLGESKFYCPIEDVPTKVVDMFWQTSFNDNLVTARMSYAQEWKKSPPDDSWFDDTYGVVGWCRSLAVLSSINPNFWQQKSNLIKIKDVDFQNIPWGKLW